MAVTDNRRSPETTTFGGIVLSGGPDVLAPRSWTVTHSRWAAALSPSVPDGALLELCAGCGAIGLEAARLTGRPLVAVDASAEACRLIRHNATRNQLVVDVREAPAARALRSGERFPLILVDPPYIPTDEVADFPEDPRHAIDGGDNGLEIAVDTMTVAAQHVSPGGVILLQLRGLHQAAAFERTAGADPALARLRLCEVRVEDDTKAIVRFDSR